MDKIKQVVVARRKERGEEDGEAGFTLIELLVVLVIIGILLSIAVPTFLGSRANAQNSAVEQTMRNGLNDMQAYYVGSDSFVGLDAAVMQSKDPSIKWTTGAAYYTTPANVVLYVQGYIPGGTAIGQSAALMELSASGECYELAQINSPESTAIQSGSTGVTGVGTWYAEFPSYRYNGQNACSGTGWASPDWSQNMTVGW